jgi:hypothetical protein
VIFPSSAVDRGFDPQSGLIKDYKIGICCFFAKYVYTALRRKNKDWLARNQDNVSEWGDMSTRGLLFQWATCSTIKNQLSVLVYYKVDLVIISFHLFSPWFSWKNKLNPPPPSKESLDPPLSMIRTYIYNLVRTTLCNDQVKRLQSQKGNRSHCFVFPKSKIRDPH